MFILVSDYDEENKILTSKISFYPFLFSVFKILSIPILLFFISIIIRSGRNLEIVENSSNINLYFVLFGFVCLTFIVTFYFITQWDKLINKIVIDFKNESLTIENNSFLTKHFIEDYSINFNEIKSIRTKVIRMDWKLNIRRMKVLILESKDEVEHILFPIFSNRSFRNKEKRIVDLLNYILRV